MTTQFESGIMQKLCETQEQAIIELIELAGFNIHHFALKGVEGARYAIEAIKEKGYVISQIETNNALESSYILQQYGKSIAQRNVSVKIKVDNKAEEGGVKEK